MLLSKITQTHFTDSISNCLVKNLHLRVTQICKFYLILSILESGLSAKIPKCNKKLTCATKETERSGTFKIPQLHGKGRKRGWKACAYFPGSSEAQYNYTCSLSENMQLCVTWQGIPYLIPLSRGNVYFRIPFARFYSTAPNENRLQTQNMKQN